MGTFAEFAFRGDIWLERERFNKDTLILYARVEFEFTSVTFHLCILMTVTLRNDGYSLVK